MVNSNYTNSNLAHDYYRYKSIQSAAMGLSEARKAARLIESAQTDISQHYQMNGNLHALHIKGVGKPRIRELELILQVGV